MSIAQWPPVTHGSALRGEAREREIERVRELTDRPFVVNHVVPNLAEGAAARRDDRAVVRGETAP